jgi:hypothetical protein
LLLPVLNGPFPSSRANKVLYLELRMMMFSPVFHRSYAPQLGLVLPG